MFTIFFSKFFFFHLDAAMSYLGGAIEVESGDHMYENTKPPGYTPKPVLSPKTYKIEHDPNFGKTNQGQGDVAGNLEIVLDCLNRS